MPRFEALTVKRFAGVTAPGRTSCSRSGSDESVTVTGADDAIARLFASCARHGPRRARNLSAALNRCSALLLALEVQLHGRVR